MEPIFYVRKFKIYESKDYNKVDWSYHGSPEYEWVCKDTGHTVQNVFDSFDKAKEVLLSILDSSISDCRDSMAKAGNRMATLIVIKLVTEATQWESE
jgi:hypothetical protein